jgi:photosynthetic reaction center H subunit
MGFGSFTHYIDIPQVVLYLFWIFFAGLIYYLRREDKREGYPLESNRSNHIRVQGFPPIPAAKTFKLRDGGTYQAPQAATQASLTPKPTANYASPPAPAGNPLLAGVGPGAYVERANSPDITVEGTPKIVPLRAVPAFSIAAEDPDPRGMQVIAADGNSAGVVREVWIDLSEPQIRYLEVESHGRIALLPINFARINGARRRIQVNAILASQFAQIPATAQPDIITLREEDRITAYFGGGYLYAEPSRAEPLI